MSCSSAECCHSRRCSANLYSRSQLALRMLLAVSSSLRKSLNFAAHKTQGLRLHSRASKRARAEPSRAVLAPGARRGEGLASAFALLLLLLLLSLVRLILFDTRRRQPQPEDAFVPGCAAPRAAAPAQQAQLLARSLTSRQGSGVSLCRLTRDRERERARTLIA